MANGQWCAQWQSRPLGPSNSIRPALFWSFTRMADVTSSGHDRSESAAAGGSVVADRLQRPDVQ